MSTQAGTRSWRPCRIRPAPLIRSTSWLMLSGTRNRKFKHSGPMVEICMHLARLATNARRAVVQKFLVARIKARRDHTALPTAAAGIALCLVTSNLNVLGLEQGANQDKEGKNKGNKGDGKGFLTRVKKNGISVASSSWAGTDPCGRMNSKTRSPGVSPSPQPQQSGTLGRSASSLWMFCAED